MAKKKLFLESELATLAKEFREKSGKKKIEASRELKVSRANITLAEDNPEQSLTKLRCRMIENYSSFSVVGPVFLLKKKGKGSTAFASFSDS